MKWRKKPVVIEAEQYDRGRPAPEGVCFCMPPKPDPGIGRLPRTDDPHVHTLEGPLHVSHLDWIITGTKGEKYPCKDHIFAELYEPVHDEDPKPMVDIASDQMKESI